MEIISKECAFSFRHFVKNNIKDGAIVEGIDQTFIDIMKATNMSTIDRAKKAGLDDQALQVLSDSLTVVGICYYHLFRIQKESDDLERNTG